MATPQPLRRPLSISLIALFQCALAVYCFGALSLALVNPQTNVPLLRSALLLLLGQNRPSRSVASPEDATVGLFFFGAAALSVGAYSAASGWGLWRLRKWARHSVAGQYGVMLALWARSFLFFGIGGGFSRVPVADLQPAYMAITVEAIICLTLLYHGGVAEAFGENE